MHIKVYVWQGGMFKIQVIINEKLHIITIYVIFFISIVKNIGILVERERDEIE